MGANSSSLSPVRWTYNSRRGAYREEITSFVKRRKNAMETGEISNTNDIYSSILQRKWIQRLDIWYFACFLLDFCSD